MRTDILFLIGGFIAGVAAGVLMSKDHYQQIADEEIRDFKDAWKEHKAKKSQNEQKEYEEQAGKYASDSETPDGVHKANLTNSKEEGNTEVEVEIVSPYDFGEKDGYEMLSYTYYEADGTVADSADEVVENPEEILGDFKPHFGEYEDDSVFVRNHKLKADIEILKDVRTYKEAMDIVAHPQEE